MIHVHLAAGIPSATEFSFNDANGWDINNQGHLVVMKGGDPVALFNSTAWVSVIDYPTEETPHG